MDIYSVLIKAKYYAILSMTILMINRFKRPFGLDLMNRI